jgi:hypothetical protein
MHGISLGRPADLVLDLENRRAVGLDVICGDGVHRFLPLPAARVGATAIASALMLLDETDSFYRKRAAFLRDLRGGDVEVDGARVGPLRDVVLGEDWGVPQILVGGDRAAAPVEFDARVRLRPQRGHRSAA